MRPCAPCADAASASLRLYCHDLDQGRLWEVLEGLRLVDKVHVASKVDQADAVLSVRCGGRPAGAPRGLRGCGAAGLRGCGAAGLRGCGAAGLRGLLAG
jgi:hypothetical protein